MESQGRRLGRRRGILISNADGNVLIAENYPRTASVARRQEMAANAHLISAAPELLQALKAVCAELTSTPGGARRIREMCEEVIAKAEGR